MNTEEFAYPVVCILVNRINPRNEPEILLQKRTKPNASYFGLWELPQGRIKQGEMVLDAVRRELEEETTLSLLKFDSLHSRSQGLVSSSQIESLYPVICVVDPQYAYIGIGIIVSAVGEVIDTEEASKHQWLNKSGVERLIKSSSVFPMNVPIINEYFRLKQQ